MNNKNTLAGWGESLVITILFLSASVFLQAPLSLSSPFPWIWFAPVLVALRYGLWPSQMSMLILIAYHLYLYPQQLHLISFQLFVLGGFLLTLSCALFHSRWAKKLIYNEQISEYLQKRIQNTAYAYKVVLLAYQRLEHSIISKPVTVRNSLMELRELLARQEDKLNPDILYRFLNIISFYCSLEVAGIFPVKNNKVLPEAITTIGKVKPLNPMDFLIHECLDKKAMTYISTQEILKGHWTEYLVVAPFFDQNESIYALLIIEEMSFLKLNDENLEILHLFLGYFVAANLVEHAHALLEKYPDCDIDFANELQRLCMLQKTAHRDSAVVAFWFNSHPHQEEYLFKLKQETRGIDTLWETHENGIKILLVLMPLSNRLAIESYKARIEAIFTKEFNIKLNEAEVKCHSCLVSSFTTPLELLNDLLGKT
ncbi:PelD GGDEF domain-containing protein [Legionella rowbothamii]|uniref:PelD GGDEF domain-containing protein n=1 Tax=Legionella rowbothamii TaxID=96229 RepID=UPI0010559A7D|nr:PelD GGDEF domain-containing protein [Legionella rowbothamii]